MTDAEIQQALQALAQLGAAAGNSRASIQSVGQSMAKLRGEMQRGGGTVQEYTQELRRVIREYESLDESVKKSSAGQAMFAEQSRMAGQVLRQSLGDFAGEITKIGIGQALEYFKGQVFSAAKSVQENASGTQAAFDLQNSAIDNQIKTLDMLSQSTEKASMVLAMIPGWSRGLAVLGAGASAALSFKKGITELQKNGLQVLQTEIKKSELAFNSMTASGAIFTNGVTEMRNTYIDTKLDVTEFSKVVSSNTTLLSQLGGTVNGGIQRFKEVGMQMGRYRKDLLNLGYSYQDQAQAQLEYMDILNQSGRLSQTNAKDIAKGTNDYLVNMRAISAFTGEDAKRAQARAKESSAQLAVQSKLMSQGDGAMERFQSGIKNMEPFMQKALQEATAFDGTVVDKGLNQLFAMSPTRQKLFEQTYQDTQNTALSAEDITRRYQERVKELGPAMAAEAKELGGSLGAANLAIGSFPELTKQVEATLQLGIKGSEAQKTAAQNTVDAAHGLAQTTDSLRNTLSAAQIVFKEYSAAVNNYLTSATKQFAEKGLPALEGIFKNKGLVQQVGDSMGYLLASMKTVGIVGENINRVLPELKNRINSFITEDRNRGVNPEGPTRTPAAPAAREPRAEGGPVTANTQYLVGEKGPELFRPDQSGQIFTNNNLTAQIALLKDMKQNPPPPPKVEDTTSSVKTAVDTVINNPNLLTNSLTMLTQNLESSNKEQTVLIQKYIEKMDTLITTMQDNVDYSKRIADNIA